MGFIVKALLFFFVIITIIRWLLRPFLSGLNHQPQDRGYQQQRRQDTQGTRSGHVHVNQQPDPNSRKNKTSDDYKGGDYIDFEEVD
jgi:membrane protein implicated in regulation of membrane protease activity